MLSWRFEESRTPQSLWKTLLTSYIISHPFSEVESPDLTQNLLPIPIYGGDCIASNFLSQMLLGIFGKDPKNFFHKVSYPFCSPVCQHDSTKPSEFLKLKDQPDAFSVRLSPTACHASKLKGVSWGYACVLLDWKLYLSSVPLRPQRQELLLTTAHSPRGSPVASPRSREVSFLTGIFFKRGRARV